MFRHDDGSQMNAKQVCDIAWDQFGAAEIIKNLAIRLAWNARHEGQVRAEAISKDADEMLKIAERLERLAAKEAV